MVPMFAKLRHGPHGQRRGAPLSKIGANWTMDGFRAIERWWFA